MRIASLGSGSQGNATLVRSEQACFLIDCGFSLSQVVKRLARLDLTPECIDAILVTHEHSDHGQGVERLAERYSIPMWMTVGTARALGVEDYSVLMPGHSYSLQDCCIEVITVPHDAAEPVQFVMTEQSSHRRLGILTDSGHITPHMLQAYSDLNGLLLEFNYDPQMLETGPYPHHLKRRVGGNHGHLSNQQSMHLLQAMNTDSLGCLIAAHISQKNNSPALVSELLGDLTLPSPAVIACQDEGFDWIEI